MAATILFSSLVIAQPGTPHPCLFPSQFTTMTETTNFLRNTVQRGLFVYDGVGRRTYEQEEFRDHDGGSEKDTITLYDEDIHYEIDRESRECFFGPIPDNRKFAPFGVPGNASFHAQIYLGITPQAVAVNAFGDRFAMGDRTITYHGHVTADGCFPVKTHMFISSADEPMVPDHSEIRSFFNGVLGIEDPDVFTPPAFGCQPFPPSPPGPAPGPAPPTPTRDCLRGLELKCGQVQHNATACPHCVREYGPEFKCTTAEDSQFCETPRPLECSCRANINVEAEAFSIITRVPGPGHCCDICRGTTNCHESAFLDGRCYLHNTSTSPTKPAKGTTLCVQPREPPRPPSPPRPPAPPGPSPERECWAGLIKACEKDRTSPTECAACVAKEGPSVKCTTAEEQAFCRHPAPPAPPTPRPPPAPPNPADECFKGLEKVCESERHDPDACAACAKKEGALVHCTPALEASFCSPH